MRWTACIGYGGTIRFVGVNTEKTQYLDLEMLARAAMAVD